MKLPTFGTSPLPFPAYGVLYFSLTICNTFLFRWRVVGVARSIHLHPPTLVTISLASRMLRALPLIFPLFRFSPVTALLFVFVYVSCFSVMFQNARQDLVAINRGSGVETASTIWSVVKWDVLYGAAYFLMAFSDNMVCLYYSRGWKAQVFLTTVVG